MPKIPFTVSARTAKLIGQENFSNEQGAVVELVKNGYDADATICIIIFHNNSLYIIDNGSGMTDKVINEEWMTIGTNEKEKNHTTPKGRVKTGAKGIGRFALDRLSQNTIIYTFPEEERESLIWRVDWNNFNKEKINIHDVQANLWKINKYSLKKFLFKEFRKCSFLKNIINDIEDKLLQNGTVLKMNNLKDTWYFDEIESLYKNLEILTPPKEVAEKFKISLYSSEYQENFGDIDIQEISDFDYKIEASYQPENEHILEIKIVRNELEKTKINDEYKKIFDYPHMQTFPYDIQTFRKDEFVIRKNFFDLKSFSETSEEIKNQIGKFDFIFYFLKLTQSDDKEDGFLVKYPYRRFTASERKNVLDKFGGIKIFRDNFRVRPYGEGGDDWLKLGKRQAQSPGGAGQRLGGYKIRPQQILGTINISRLENVNFEDKSGREGLQENKVFTLFKNIIIEIISYFETDRNMIMHALFKHHKKQNEDALAIITATQNAEKYTKNKNQSSESQSKKEEKQDENRFSSNDEETYVKATLAFKEKLNEKEEEIRLLRNLASVGLIISSFSHEVHSLRTRLIPRNVHLKEILKTLIKPDDIKKLDEYDDPFKQLEDIEKEDIKLKHWLDYSLNSLKKDKRKRNKIDLVKYFNSFQDNWYKALEQRKIKISIEKDKLSNYQMHAFEVDLDVIFNNLLSNSINALKSVKKMKKNKEIKIKLSNVDNFIIVEFIDNGPGLSKIYKENQNKIFTALESSKVDKQGNSIGTGLGLYLVKTTVEEYKDSNIEIMDISEGFGIQIQFKPPKE